MVVTARRRFVRPLRPDDSTHCVDCQMETWPAEFYMTTDAIWQEAGDPRGCLCIGCLEDRLDRVLEPEDFPPLPLNDDEEMDTVRLRLRKGSGRATAALYAIAEKAVLDLGADLDEAAASLGLDAALLGHWVAGGRLNREFAKKECC
jgi:hypothetical protein